MPLDTSSGRPKDASRRWRCLLQCAFLALLVSLIYSNTLHSPFVLDDWPNIEHNVHIRLTELTWDSLTKAAFASLASNRPVANLSFALNYYFHQEQVLGYHLVNIFIHITTGILLYLFVNTTLCLPWWHASAGRPDSIAFFTALLWLVHPLHTQSVTYIVQRMNSMATMFYILAVVLYAWARLAETRWKKCSLFAGCTLAGLCALSSKEIAATLPCFIVIYEWYFFQGLCWSWFKRHGVYVVGVLLFLVLMAFVYLGAHPVESTMASYTVLGFDLPSRALTQFRVVMFYVYLLLLPYPAHMNLDHDFVLSMSLFDPLTTLLAFGAIVGGLGWACIGATRARLRSFCLVWFWGNLVIESSVIGLEIAFEHRTYLPSLLLSLLLVIGVYRYLKPAWLRVGLLCAVALVYAGWTYDRNRVWADAVTLWSDCVQKSPYKARPHVNLGVALAQQGKLAEAIDHYTEALRLQPTYAEAHSKLGAALAQQGKLGEAIGHYTEALQLNPTLVEAHTNLGVALAQQGKIAEAMRHLTEALHLQPTHAVAHNNLGTVLGRQGKVGEAIGHYTEALRLNPTYAEAHNNLGVAMGRQGKVAEAMGHYTEALRLNPTYAEAYNNLGDMFVKQGQQSYAIAAYRTALHYRPGWPRAANHLAWLLVTQERPSSREVMEAVQLAEAACQATSSQQASMLVTLAVAYAAAGQQLDAIRTARQAVAQAEATGETMMMQQIRERLERYGLPSSARDAP